MIANKVDVNSQKVILHIVLVSNKIKAYNLIQLLLFVPEWPH